MNEFYRVIRMAVAAHVYFRCERCDICVDLYMIYNYMLRMAFLIEFAGGFITFL